MFVDNASLLFSHLQKLQLDYRSAGAPWEDFIHFFLSLVRNYRKVVLVENCCCRLSHWLGSHCRAGSVKFDKRMYFLENDRRYCRTYNNLEASLQKELSFYQQKAKEWAEVHTRFFFSVKIIHDTIHDVSPSHSIIFHNITLYNGMFREIALCIYITMGNI